MLFSFILCILTFRRPRRFSAGTGGPSDDKYNYAKNNDTGNEIDQSFTPNNVGVMPLKTLVPIFHYRNFCAKSTD